MSARSSCCRSHALKFRHLQGVAYHASDISRWALNPPLGWSWDWWDVATWSDALGCTPCAPYRDANQVLDRYTHQLLCQGFGHKTWLVLHQSLLRTKEQYTLCCVSRWLGRDEAPLIADVAINLETFPVCWRHMTHYALVIHLFGQGLSYLARNAHHDMCLLCVCVKTDSILS
jgi:hypothetical protein